MSRALALVALAALVGGCGTPAASSARPAAVLPTATDPALQVKTAKKVRAGALRLARASRARHELRFEPRDDLRLPETERRLGARRLHAEVAPFAERELSEPAAEPVPRAGELVALALALQLERLGWLVDVADADLCASGLPVPASAGGEAAAQIRVTGEVRFASSADRARLDGTVHVSHAGARRISLSLSTEGTAAGELPSARRRLAAERALAAFVARVLAAPELDRGLAALIPAR